LETCASVRECQPSGKSRDLPDAALISLPHRVELPDSAAVWLIPLEASTLQLQQCAKLLSPAEQSRIGRLHFERDRRRHTIARGMLRMLLGEHLAISPAAIEFGLGQYGKPALASPHESTNFNLSHTADLALCAISRTDVAGVDIERLDRVIDHDGLACKFFSAREQAELQRIPAAARKRAFLTCWTRKEAVAKATGQGLHLPLREIEVNIDPDAPPQLLNLPAMPVTGWTLHTIDAGSLYAATVALHPAG
jgi:4'-phosphopantetheinyl transferase